MDTPRRATITLTEIPKENTLGIEVEFFPELNLQDGESAGLAHLVFTALEAIKKKRNAMSDEAPKPRK